MSKLSEEQIVEIARDYATNDENGSFRGPSYFQKKFGVTSATIYNVRKELRKRGVEVRTARGRRVDSTMSRAIENLKTNYPELINNDGVEN